jgi:hypothetical protein
MSHKSKHLRDLENLANMLKNFDDAVTAEEVFYDTIPIEFIEAFGESTFTTPAELTSNDDDTDLWGSEGKKQELKRKK